MRKFNALAVLLIGLLCAGCSSPFIGGGEAYRPHSEYSSVHAEVTLVRNDNFGSPLTRGQYGPGPRWAIAAGEGSLQEADDAAVEAVFRAGYSTFKDTFTMERKGWVGICPLGPAYAFDSVQIRSLSLKDDGVLRLFVDHMAVRYMGASPVGADVLILVDVGNSPRVSRIEIQVRTEYGATYGDRFFSDETTLESATVAIK